MSQMSGMPAAPSMEAERKPVLSARQIGVAAAFGGAALAVVLAGITIPIPGTPVVTAPLLNGSGRLQIGAGRVIGPDDADYDRL